MAKILKWDLAARVDRAFKLGSRGCVTPSDDPDRADLQRSIGTPLGDEYIVVMNSSSGRMVFGCCREAWGSWPDEDAAREWMRKHCDSSARVVRLLPLQLWYREIALLFPRQSGETQKQLSHVVVLRATGVRSRGRGFVEGKQDAIGPVFFREESDSPLGAKKVVLRELGERYVSLAPLLDYRQYPKREFKIVQS